MNASVNLRLYVEERVYKRQRAGRHEDYRDMKVCENAVFCRWSCENCPVHCVLIELSKCEDSRRGGNLGEQASKQAYSVKTT